MINRKFICSKTMSNGGFIVLLFGIACDLAFIITKALNIWLIIVIGLLMFLSGLLPIIFGMFRFQIDQEKIKFFSREVNLMDINSFSVTESEIIISYGTGKRNYDVEVDLDGFKIDLLEQYCKDKVKYDCKLVSDETLSSIQAFFNYKDQIKIGVKTKSKVIIYFKNGKITKITNKKIKEILKDKFEQI